MESGCFCEKYYSVHKKFLERQKMIKSIEYNCRIYPELKKYGNIHFIDEKTDDELKEIYSDVLKVLDKEDWMNRLHERKETIDELFSPDSEIVKAYQNIYTELLNTKLSEGSRCKITLDEMKAIYEEAMKNLPSFQINEFYLI